ncbi:MAG TPA: hypothetical protein VFW33_06560, partial [Gemmataceae bacterium]|nr:hypothetical protein [Gemmataceae bacterium]
WTLLGAVAAGIGHWLLWMCCAPLLIMRSDLVPDFMDRVWEYQGGLTPPVNLGWFASFRAGEVAAGGPAAADVWERALFGALGTATWALLAFVLWVAARRRFRILAGRGESRLRLGDGREIAKPQAACTTGDDKEPIDVHHQ